MIRQELTGSVRAAKTQAWRYAMQGGQQMQRSGWRAVRALLVVTGCSLTASACVSVSAPDKPIVIELNINIKQEVIYRLSADAAKTIDTNPEIF